VLPVKLDVAVPMYVTFSDAHPFGGEGSRDGSVSSWVRVTATWGAFGLLKVPPLFNFPVSR
jgi:hypothetical protein